MQVKLFLPSELFDSGTFCELYGIIEVDNNEIKFFVLESRQNAAAANLLMHIGQICDSQNINKAKKCENFVYLTHSADKNSNKLLVNKIFLKEVEVKNSNEIFIVYDAKGFGYLSENNIALENYSPDNELLQLSKLIKVQKEPVKSISQSSGNFFGYQALLKLWITLNFILHPFNRLFKKTAVFCHFSDWKTWIKTVGYKSGKWTIFFDIGFGIAVLALVLYFGNPGIYFMHYAELLVNNLRQLLKTLKGSPVGLKLNILLNEFFLDCFMYHVDLWWTFLIIVSPVIHYLFVPLSILGLFGLSFQLAMLSDLIILISLHAHCFYIYAAVLYKIEIDGIKALCRIVLGRKKNVLRGRVESYEYMNRQLFLATLLFTIFLFLLPTILVYYIVFASLRFTIYCTSFLIMTIRRRMLLFPFHPFIRWLAGTYVNFESIEIREVSKCSMTNATTIHVMVKPANFWSKNMYEHKEIVTEKSAISIGQFFLNLVKGEMVGFIQPDESFYK